MNIIELNNKRTNRCRDYFCELILNELQNYKVWVAGGAIRSWFANERRSDIDLFFPSEKGRNKALNHIKGIGSEVVFENENVTKVRHKDKYTLDFCKQYFPDPEKTISDFDFTVAMFACNRESFWCGEESFMDLASKRLCFNQIPFPHSSLMRLQRYIKKGYWMCSEEAVKFTAVLQKIDLTSFVVEDQFIPNFPESESGNTFPGMD